jgi:ribosomal protein S18 acetylase RimI-like enzyme
MDRNRRQQPDKRLSLVPAIRVPLSVRVMLINRAFADYYVPFHVSEDQVSRMDQVYHVDLDRSVVAFVGTEAVGLALLGRRKTRGWIHSVGTVPAWRHRGIAKAMVAQVIAAAAEGEVEELTLEVFSENALAFRLYQSLGFSPRRELLSWLRPGDEGPLPIPRERLVPARAALLCDLLTSWQARLSKTRVGDASTAWDAERPCWQRELESLRGMGSALTGYRLPVDGLQDRQVVGQTLGSLAEGEAPATAGCCLVSAGEQAISILAASVHPGSDRLAYGRELLLALSAAYPGLALSILNVPEDAFLCRILAGLRFKVTARQLELVRHLL